LIIDTHCHLDNVKYKDDLEEVIIRAKEVGVEKFIIPGASPDDLSLAVKLSNQYDEVYFAVGVHPYDIDNFELDLLEKYITHPKCVAVGECGLDFYRMPKDNKERKRISDSQIEIFKIQINLAKKYKKPLIVHIREASQKAKEVLIEENASEVGGVLHCFNASEILLNLAEKGFYFGIGGVVTFKNGKKLKEILPKIPKEKLLIETDAPYLTPEPFRGTRNEPKYTIYIAKEMAKLLNMTQSEIEDLTTTNAKRLFKI